MPRFSPSVTLIAALTVIAGGCTRSQNQAPTPATSSRAATLATIARNPDPVVAQADALVRDMQQLKAAYQATAEAEARAEAIRQETTPRD